MAGKSCLTGILRFIGIIFVLVFINSCQQGMKQLQEFNDTCGTIHENLQESMHDAEETTRKVLGKPKELKEKAEKLIQSGKETAKDVFENYLDSRKIFGFSQETEIPSEQGKKAYRELKWSVRKEEPVQQTETPTDDENKDLQKEL